MESLSAPLGLLPVLRLVRCVDLTEPDSGASTGELARVEAGDLAFRGAERTRR
jgi:hypothetical protein